MADAAYDETTRRRERIPQGLWRPMVDPAASHFRKDAILNRVTVKSDRRGPAFGVLPAAAVALATAAAMALAGCSGSGSPSDPPSGASAAASEGQSDAAEELYFYAVSSVSHKFHLLEMRVDQDGRIEGTDTVVMLHENRGTEVREVDTEFVGTRSGDSFEFERLHDGRILTAALENGILTFIGQGTIGNHEVWTQIESVQPFEDMLDVHQEANAGCEDDGSEGCAYNNLEWPTELPTDE